MDGDRIHVAMTVDGNALAGMLDDVFTGDVTTMVASCRGCGRTGPLAETVVERDAACAIVRCRGCSRTLITVLQDASTTRIELGAIAILKSPH